MDKRERILETAFKRYTQKTSFVKEALEKRGCNKKESTEVLRQLNLDSVTNRVKIVRDMESKLEDLIDKNINGETFDFIVRELKKYTDEKYKELNITEDVIKSFIGSRYFETINDMRAFKAICDSDLDTYKMFAGDSRELLMYGAIRVLALITQDSDKVRDMGEYISKEFDEKYNGEKGSTYERLLKKEMGKDGYLVKGYSDEMNGYRICFYNGIVDILEPVLREHGYGEYCDGGVKMKEAAKEVEINKVVESEIATDSSIVTVEDTVDENVFEALKEKTKELMAMVSGLEDRVKAKESLEVVVTNEDHSKELEEIRLENARLKNELDRLKAKAEGPSLKSFIQLAGGRSGNYQLSELYLIAEDMVKDDGNSVGRFINILTMLESFGVSAYFGNRKFNEEFEIERRELSKQYMLEMPLRGDNEVVKVKLIKNGWMLDGQVIVLPLVVQL